MSTRPLRLVVLLATTACNRGSGSSPDDHASSGSSDGGDAGTTDTASGDTGDSGSASATDGTDTGDGGDVPFMPIGIPEPEFGIHELAPPMPAPWDAPIAGAYYVDNTHANATDDDAATGTPAAPRTTIPASLAAGSTVWIAGGPYPGFAIAAAGTPEAPVFVTAADPSTPPVVTGGVGLSGSWLALEHLDVVGAAAGIAIATPSDHVAVRHCEVHDGEGGGTGIYTGRWEPEDDPSVAQHIVFYDNYVHDNGDLLADFDEDHHGFGVGHHAEQVWIIDNEMAKNSGDGLQINAKKDELAETLHHVWVGRNVTHENKQNGLWTKQATDVVFSQNASFGHRPSNSSSGACIGFQYGPERVWILFNALYDCEVGIASATAIGDEDDVAGSGQDIYIVGNLILAIHKQDGSGASDDPWQLGAGIGLTDQAATKHVAFNTIVDTDVAFSYARGTGGVELLDNVFVASLGAAITIESSEAAGASSVDAMLLDDGATIGWGAGNLLDLAGLQSQGQCSACITGDPLFVDAMAADFHVQAGSPAVDTGAPSTIAASYQALYGESIDVDFDRAPRVAGARVDLGAYER